MGSDEKSWRRELAIGAALLGFGLFLLPVAIYIVGSRIFGEYAPGAGGAFVLAEHLWLDLVALRPFAWLLVLSPYLLVQLIRAVRRLWRESAA
jgi:hypothetical protein